MPVLDRYRHGTPCWVDLSTTDLTAAKEFYSGLFGWEYADEEMGEMGIGTYSMALVDGRATAAIYQLGPGQLRPMDGSAWNVYVSVDDVATSFERARELGKIVAGVTSVDRAGRIAVIEDPTGCRTTLWEPNEFRGSVVRAEIGAVTWFEHVSSDRRGSVEYFEKVLGIETATRPMDGLDGYTTWVVDGIEMAGMFQWPDRMIADGVPSMWFVYFQVDDLDAAADYVESNGGKAMADEPAEADIGRMIVLRDPQEADFCVVESRIQAG